MRKASVMSTSGIRIRKAVQRDVDAVVRLANAGGPEGKPRQELPAVLPQAYMLAFDSINADPNHLLMVAELNRTVVGTFHMTFLTYLAGAGHPDAQIEAIHVAAAHRRQGIGSAMLQWAIDEAKRRECRRVQLTTDKRRTDAHVLYQRLGFSFSHEGAKLNL